MSSDSAKPPVLLRDYRAPAWRVAEVELEFDLDPAATIVVARLLVERSVAVAPAEPLRLDAEQVELLELRIDGRALAAEEYRFDAEALTIPLAGDHARVETRVRIAPETNTALQGLYTSGRDDARFLLTQCEAEGFRRITPFPDRPDVLARYTVTLRADRQRFPLLLANGNADGAGELDDGRHWARFVDPHPKPSYLFALVAGRLETIEDHFVTAEGRRVRLAIHAEADAIGRCDWAMQCLKLAMRWDEQRFGRCYDLDVFHVVATHDFTMGAMENKGLNVFNAKYLLADPERATDDAYRHVLAVVGHEYFHNWSGNRVTCRDWFQLSLKEGLTVYREQEFESDLASRTLRRIEDVRMLWRAQFAEDAGPLAHPVRPDRYSEINNFYTATVYEKGAEIVRMLSLVLGRDGFRRGLDLYFERHDGEAATVEDFLAALGEANATDLSPWLAWYGQAGTPTLEASERYDAATRRYELTLAQHTAPTPGQPRKQALPIPVAVALFDEHGARLPLRLDGDAAPPGQERVLPLHADRATFRFVDVPVRPVVSLLRGYSAPVRLRWSADAVDLAVQIRHDDDGFNRWFAADALARRLFAEALAAGGSDARSLEVWTRSLAEALNDDALDPALAAEMLTVADANSLAEELAEIDPEAVHLARASIETALARALAEPLARRYRALSGALDAQATDPAAQARRRLRNVCLAALCRADAAQLPLAEAQFAQARNLTDRIGALSVLLSTESAAAAAALDAFAARYAGDALVLDQWLSLQATQARADTVERVAALTAHAVFRWTNPNNVYALIGAFALRNPRAFHRADGAGYRFVAEAIARLDALTPQVAARLATAFGGWRRLEPVRRALMHRELQRLAARETLSPDLADIVARSLAG
ncbi:aminopeptidase N [Dokdonella sp.]|uniref:aminopeptidase N n=1 Tax=Dokdonella sp. TaxID=2291710 RepID=UPI001B00D8BF|nr:aminopeptidase N [Dokdonella sp.]MBO9661553.1 aminopeptidase N [Dokdonella sp.]